ncbi:hypothetical protein NFIA_038740 [Paecilomyces variotii No. 5]|uniref:Telomeric single stranded DNA binding POT1/Cdc13 domain-containing protein n=1 Tax=Byssochlamys spectabilis (strain No. 5 / NBRC 109023) TaxID=1356009 RepID=V5FXL4_BYSSN|nr:hypothetical protein NFIA_038740 [Paecilomyces variotii No. 5]
MDSDDQPPAAGAVPQSAYIPISELSPDRDDINTKSVHAVVTLVWPYSSSSQSLSLLLAEPDFRLRRSQGQVKVNFHGISAQEVAQTHVGIGDEVQLSLEGVRWTDTQGPSATPGRNVSWDINFENNVSLEISRNSQHLSSVRIHKPISPPPQNDGFATPVKPTATNLLTEVEGPSLGSTQWVSPAFLRSNRQSLGGLSRAAFDPFAEEDGYVPGKGRKRPRFSMRSNEWRLVDEPASPIEADTPWDELEDMEMQDDELEAQGTTEGDASNLNGAEARSPDNIDTKDIAAVSAVVEESISTSSVGLATNDEAPVQDISAQQAKDGAGVICTDSRPEFTPPLARVDEQTGSQRTSRAPTDTPRLLPLPSPGLLVPSPLVTVSPSPLGYFPTVVEPTVSSEPPTVSTGTDDGVAPIQNAPLQESTPHDLLQEATARALEHVAADVIEASTDNNKPLSSEITAGASTQLTHSATADESGLPTKQSNFGVVEQRISTAADEAVHIDEEAAEAVEVRSLSESIEAESNAFDAGDPNIEEIQHADSEDASGHGEYDSMEQDEGSSDRSQNYSRSPVPVEEESEDESEMSEEEMEAEVEYAVQGNIRHNTREGPEESAHDASSYVTEDEYDDAEEDEDQSEQEFDREYESDHVYEDEYEGSLESDAESEDERPTRPQVPASQKTVQPEIIVLDSDSEEESGVAGNHSTVLPEDQEDVLMKETETYQNQPSVFPATHAEGWEETQDDEEGAGYSETEESQDDDQSETSVAARSPTAHEDILESDEVHQEVQEEIQEEIQKEIHEEVQEEIQKEIHEEVHAENRSPSEESHTSVNHPFFTPEADIGQSAKEHDGGAIDPELFRQQEVPSSTVRNDHEDVQDQSHENTPPSQGTNLSRRDQGLFLDGPSSPQRNGKVETYSHQHMDLHGQLPTPNATQQAEPMSPEPDGHIAKPESLPTPENIQDFSTEKMAESRSSLPDTAFSTHTEMAPTRSIDGIVEEVSVLNPKGPIPPEDKPVAADDTGFDHEEHPEIQPSIENDTHIVDQQPVQVGVEISRAASLANAPALPDRKARGLRSAHSYFAPLATLFDLFNSVIDTISVVAETSPVPRSTSGPRDQFLTLQLTDPSMAGTTLSAQIFRPDKTALPAVEEGDVILLRNFKVRTFNHSMMLLSTDTSAWAVFNSGADEARATAGAPVEHDPEEHSYADSLREWYREDGAAMVADYRLQSSIDRASREDTPLSSAAISDTGSIDSALRESRSDSLSSTQRSRRNRRSNRRITIHELRDGTRYTEVGSPSGKESIHELRDGTVYANL